MDDIETLVESQSLVQADEIAGAASSYAIDDVGAAAGRGEELTTDMNPLRPGRIGGHHPIACGCLRYRLLHHLRRQKNHLMGGALALARPGSNENRPGFGQKDLDTEFVQYAKGVFVNSVDLIRRKDLLRRKTMIELSIIRSRSDCLFSLTISLAPDHGSLLVDGVRSFRKTIGRQMPLLAIIEEGNFAAGPLGRSDLPIRSAKKASR